MIVPAINCRDFKAAVVQIKKVSQFLPSDGWVHLDVSDGKFSSDISWGNPSELGKMLAEGGTPNLKLEVHLMVQEPETVIDSWLKAGAKRIIIHLEAVRDPHFVLDTVKKYRAEAMLAVGPTTSVETLVPYLRSFQLFQILAVLPGPAGQKFDREVLSKIKFLRERAPDVKIEVDGGINPETAKLAKDAGADILVSASYIMNSPNPKGAYNQLQNI